MQVKECDNYELFVILYLSPFTVVVMRDCSYAVNRNGIRNWLKKF